MAWPGTHNQVPGRRCVEGAPLDDVHTWVSRVAPAVSPQQGKEFLSSRRLAACRSILLVKLVFRDLLLMLFYWPFICGPECCSGIGRWAFPDSEHWEISAGLPQTQSLKWLRRSWSPWQSCADPGHQEDSHGLGSHRLLPWSMASMTWLGGRGGLIKSD